MSSNTASSWTIHRNAVVAALHNMRGDFAPVLPIAMTATSYIPLDLSARNSSLMALGIRDTARLSEFIFGHLKSKEAAVGYGGYNEERGWYQRSELFEEQGEPRTVHLGIDLWAAAGVSVAAPMAGRIHSFQDNANFADYGPTLILEHRILGYPLFSLYGHLSRESLVGKQVGQPIAAGEKIGSLGAPPINGDWPPHLHFQLTLDMLGKQGDFPGVAAQSMREYFLELCPDPTPVLQLK